MIKKLFKTKDRRLIGIYVLTSLLLYGSFWLAYYNISGSAALWLAAALAVFGLLILLVRFKSKKDRLDRETEAELAALEDMEEEFKDSIEFQKYKALVDEKYTQTKSQRVLRPKFPFIPFITIICVNIAIGFTMAAFFLIEKIEPSRFFGLVLLIMLAYKIGQLILGEFFALTLKSKKLFGVLLTVCLVLEIIGCIVVGIYAWTKADILWQVFYALLLCVFLSLGQIHVRTRRRKNFWDEAAMAYLIGFIYIFFITIIIIAISQGSDFDLSFDFGGGGGRKKKKIK